MGKLAEISAEREEALTAAHGEYLEAFEAYMTFLSSLHPTFRGDAEKGELMRLETDCASKKYHYQKLKSIQWQVNYPSIYRA